MCDSGVAFNTLILQRKTGRTPTTKYGDEWVRKMRKPDTNRQNVCPIPCTEYVIKDFRNNVIK